MQEQAAPARFHGVHPIPCTIPKKYLPPDRFFQNELQKYIDDGSLTQTAFNVSGHFPRLIISIRDPEIQQLAGDDLSLFDGIDCKDIVCTCDAMKPRYEQLLPGNNPKPDSILYNNCKRTIFAAAKRQVKAAPAPDAAVALHFVQWSKAKIEELIGDELDDFGYSVSQWMNHLTLAKQQDMMEVREYLFGNDETKDHYVGRIDPKLFHYEAICKVEIQDSDGKPRMVCSIPKLMKYIMGPVCWKLEEIFQDKIPSYCGGMNLNELETKINHYIDLGFTQVAEGDGSAFDNTQDVFLKEVDRYVYGRIARRIHHVPIELFEYCANQYYKVMDVMLANNKAKRCIMRYAILGTVFSGDCDTTCMNTLRMGFYNWYTNEMNGLKFLRDFIAFAKGDDFTVMYHYLVDRTQAEKGYWKYFLAKFKPKENEPDDRQFGLGQILKFIEFGGPEIIKFCSLRAYVTDESTQHIYLMRDPKKFLHLSKYSRKTVHMRMGERAIYCLQQADGLRTMYSGIKYMETMADLYEDVATRMCRNNPTLMSGLVSKIKRSRDRRKFFPLEPQEDLGDHSYKPRHTYITLVAGLTWWESMQVHYHTKTTQLTQRELEYVNSTMMSEFPSEMLTALLGLVAS